MIVGRVITPQNPVLEADPLIIHALYIIPNLR